MKGLSFRTTPYRKFLSTAAVVSLLVGVTTGIYAYEPVKRRENHTGVDEVTKVKLQESYGKLPLSFIENQGQMSEKVRFYERGHGRTLFFTDRGVYVSLIGTNPRTHHDESSTPVQNKKSELIRFIPLGANSDPEIHAEGLQEGKVHYFKGNDPQKWKTNIPTYQSVVYKDMYEGIDMRFYGNNRQMEYDIIVHPGASPSRVQLSYDGIEDLRVTEAGDLKISLKEGKLLQKKPYIYQEIEGKRVEIEGKFRVASSKHETRNSQCGIYGFKIASYDKRYPLIIDPILVYSTYLGGNREDSGLGIAVDTEGNAYITGGTLSSDFPTVNALDGFDEFFGDAFITKLNADGTNLIYSTYLGGNSVDIGWGIAVDADGNAYVTGETDSSDFPTVNAFDGNLNVGRDAFITKLNADGNILVYSTYLGGSVEDFGLGIAVDTEGNAYVTGGTLSSDFPTVNALYENPDDFGDAFVTKLNAAGTSLIYSTYLGGSFIDEGTGIAVDAAGNAYITGSTSSSDFPTANAFDGSYNGDSDVFVTKLNAAGTSLVYSTYLGGSSGDEGTGIAVDAAGNAYITGNTTSNNFHTANALDASFNGGNDAFVTKLNAAGTSLVYSTYLGGSSGDIGSGIAADTDGNAYVTGGTISPDFPTANALDASLDGGSDAFVTKLNVAGTSLVYSTYLGGSSGDLGSGIAVDAAGNAYITGDTFSSDFPTVNAFDKGFNGGFDAFVTKIASDEKPLCKAKWIKASPAQLKIKKNENGTITVTVIGNKKCPVKDETVEASLFDKGGKKHIPIISISPESQPTDANGQAVFTVHANQTGTAKVIFQTEGAKKKALTLVHVKEKK